MALVVPHVSIETGDGWVYFSKSKRMPRFSKTEVNIDIGWLVGWKVHVHVCGEVAVGHATTILRVDSPRVLYLETQSIAILFPGSR